jgi:4-amino-4-deoxy-L-arabinose transferase-like glycosyltransferase
MAIFFVVLPLTDVTARLPMALIAGLVTPVLLYLLARRIIGRTFPAVVAALIVALAPTHVVLGRQALDYLLPLPFVVGWLWCLHGFMQTQEPKHLTRGGLLLGLGCYSYLASWALMPAFLVLTLIIACRTVAFRPAVPAVIAFSILVLVAALWILAHPEMIEQTVTRYGVTEGPKYGFFETYLSMLHPNILFVRGGPSLVTSTARSGFVLAPVALLLLAGFVELWRRKDWVAAVIVAGLVLSPLPAAFKGEPSMIQRATYLLPFLGLLGGVGVVWLWRAPLTRAAAIAALALAPIQFGYFYFDYFTHYKFRSAFYYDNVAFRDVAAHLMSPGTAPAFYFDEELDDVSVKWRYYTMKSGREDLLTRTSYLEPGTVPAATPGTLLVVYDRASRLDTLKAAGWVVDKQILDVDNRLAAMILRKL